MVLVKFNTLKADVSAFIFLLIKLNRMKTKHFIALLNIIIGIHTLCLSQCYDIIYEEKILVDASGATNQIPSNLLNDLNDISSLYLLKHRNGKSKFNYMKTTSKKKIKFSSSKKLNIEYYKDFRVNKIFATETMYFNNLAATIENIHWEKTESVKNILGYNCLRMNGTFQGQMIIAYYAPEIPIKDGPKYYNNLPGLIMEIQLNDTKFVCTTIQELECEDLNNSLSIPDFETIISYEEFRKKVEFKL